MAENTTNASRHEPESEPHREYVLRLFVAGMTARSTRAVENIRALCERYLPGAYDLEVINLYEHPVLARGEHIIASPTCVREFPLPPRRVIGDMSNSARVLVGLDLVGRT
ncbi:MAG TPA: circadian clock KaiB family protein [Methylomirabilota bacterium]|nr:circadian clock KaiB family protein [Methylomirabilota bacterium]